MLLSHKGTFVKSDTNTGNQSISDVGFQPKLVLIWAAPTAIADNTWSADAAMMFGAGISSSKRFVLVAHDQDSVGTSNCGSNAANTKIIRGLASDTVTIDYEADLVSFDTNGFTINWTDAPAVANHRFNYLALGGDSITDVEIISFPSVVAATQNVTVRSGFGKPDLLIFGNQTFSGTFAAADLSLGFARPINDSTNEQASISYYHCDANTTMSLGTMCKANAITLFSSVSAPTIDAEGVLSPRTAWPTDGFQITWNDQPGASSRTFFCVALKGTFNSKIGLASSPLSTGDQDIDVGFEPVAALFSTDDMPAHTALQTSDPTGLTDSLGGMQFAGTDGTSSGLSVFKQNDGHTNSTAKSIHDLTHILRVTHAVNNSTPLDDALATVSFYGNNLRLNWSAVNATARQFAYLAIGLPPGLAENIVAPVLDDTTISVGDTVTTDDGTWDDPTATFTYQWQRDQGKDSWVDIDGETNNNYTAVIDDVGQALRCAVIATNVAGQATAYSNGTDAVPRPAGISWRKVAGWASQSDNQSHTLTLDKVVLPGETLVLLSGFSVGVANGLTGVIDDTAGDTWARDVEIAPGGTGSGIQAHSAYCPDGMGVGDAINTHVKETTIVGVNALNSPTINVVSTELFEESGVLAVNEISITYTGKTATSFTGCSSHAAYSGGEVIGYHGQSPFWAVYALGSDVDGQFVFDVGGGVDFPYSAQLHQSSGPFTLTDDGVVFGFVESENNTNSASWWTPDSGWTKLVDTYNANYGTSPDEDGTTYEGESGYSVAAQIRTATAGSLEAAGTLNASKAGSILLAAYKIPISAPASASDKFFAFL